jgi:hypothetical protein
MEDQNAQSLVRKEGLDRNEFGIRQGAEFEPLGTPTLEVREDGTVTITLSYKIVDIKDLDIGLKPLLRFSPF